MKTHRIVRPNWDDYNILMALTASSKSPDPNTQVGCYLVNKENKPVGLGYNGLPHSLDVGDISWKREGKPEETKYPFVIHAEANCILNANATTRGCVLYTTLFPCNECAKLIVQANISEVVYLEDLYPESWQIQVAKKIFGAKIKYRKYIPGKYMTSVAEQICSKVKTLNNKITIREAIKITTDNHNRMEELLKKEVERDALGTACWEEDVEALGIRPEDVDEYFNLLAERDALKKLLYEIPTDQIIDRIGLEQKEKEITEEIEKLLDGEEKPRFWDGEIWDDAKCLEAQAIMKKYKD